MDLYKQLMAQFTALCDFVCICATFIPCRIMAMDFYCLLQTLQMIFWNKIFIFSKNENFSKILETKNGSKKS